MRLDKLKTQYQRELVPLTEQREALQREILELKGVRDVFLEETTVLNARNEELAQLSNVYARRMDASPSEPPSRPEPATPQRYEDLRPPASIPAKPDQGYDEGPDARGFRMHKEPDMPTPSKGGKFMKWGSRSKEPLAPSGGSTASSETPKKPPHTEHNFQQLSVLRLTRCDQCGDKMWGSQLRCSGALCIFVVLCSLTPSQCAISPYIPAVSHMFKRYVNTNMVTTTPYLCVSNLNSPLM